MFAPKEVWPILQRSCLADLGNTRAIDEWIELQRAFDRAGRYEILKERYTNAEVSGTTQFMGTPPSEGDVKFVNMQNISTCSKKRSVWNADDYVRLKEEMDGFAFIHNCGAGAFGRVWLVEAPFWDGIVALKVIKKSETEKYKQELESLSLYMGNIYDFNDTVEIINTGETKSFFYYVMEAAYSLSKKEYIPMTLDTLLSLRNVISIESIINVIKALLKGVQQLHKNSLIHRDIKPHNIIIVDHKVKLGDIGLLSKNSNITYGGTYEFIPPDLRKTSNDSKWEGRGVDCDLYAIGKILYLLLTRYDISRFPEINLGKLKNKKERYLNSLVNKSCSDEFNTRYQDAQQFLNDLGIFKIYY